MENGFFYDFSLRYAAAKYSEKVPLNFFAPLRLCVIP